MKTGPAERGCLPQSSSLVPLGSSSSGNAAVGGGGGAGSGLTGRGKPVLGAVLQ